MKLKNIVLLLGIGALFMTACGNQNNDGPNVRPTDDSLIEPMPPTNDDTPPIDADLIEGNAYLGEVQLFIMESYPVQVSLNIKGDLPTPCHYFRSTVNSPNENNEIMVNVFSVVETGQACIEVLDPFEENVSLPLNDLEDGIYTVFVNGEIVGEFSYPG